MTNKVHFTKMHGAGNDYIYVNTLLYTIDNPAECARQWSKAHTGIGSDGLVLIGKSPVPEADFTMRIFNADGSEAMMCGNASRCIGKYIFEKGLTDKTTIRLLTLSGIKILRLTVNEGVVESVTVDMLEPQLINERQFNSDATPIGKEQVNDSLPEGTFVSMGNPHYVIFTDNIDRVMIDGPKLEQHPAFPERCNIEFAQVVSSSSQDNPTTHIRMRVWERGSGVTMACGTGACATAVAAALSGRSSRQSTIIMDGGELNIEWCKQDNHVYMTGPAEYVFEGDIDVPSS